MKKTIGFLIIALILCSLSITQAQNSYHDRQLIISFEDGTNQQDQQDLLDVYLAVILEEDVDGNILIETPSLPYTTQDGRYISDMPDLIGKIAQEGDIDTEDFNYIVSASPLNYQEIQAYFDMPDYSPIVPACESTYPGGILLGCSTPSDGNVKIGYIDSGFDGAFQQAREYIKGEVDVLNPEYDGKYPSEPIENYVYQGAAKDENGHGTALVSIATGLSERAGLDPRNVSIFVIKAFDGDGTSSLFNLKKALDAAVLLDLDILNLSWSYQPGQNDSEESGLVYKALEHLGNEQNVILVTGSGNDYESLDTYDLIPAGAPGINNLITVGAVDCNGDVPNFSNTGAAVDIYAPGEDINAPIIDSYFGLGMTGTSYSTGIATAALAQVWLKFFKAEQEATPNDIAHVQQILLTTATQTAGSNIPVVDFAAACAAATAEGHQNFRADNSTVENARFDAKGKEANTIATTIQVFPNPVEAQLNVTIDLLERKEAVNITLYTLTGQKVQSHNLDQSEGSVTLDISGLPNGPYLIKVQHGQEIWSELIIKE